MDGLFSEIRFVLTTKKLSKSHELTKYLCTKNMHDFAFTVNQLNLACYLIFADLALGGGGSLMLFAFNNSNNVQIYSNIEGKEMQTTGKMLSFLIH